MRRDHSQIEDEKSSEIVKCRYALIKYLNLYKNTKYFCVILCRAYFMQYFTYQTFRSVILPYYESIDRAPFDADTEPGLDSELLINGQG